MSFTVDPVFNRIARGSDPDSITDKDLLKFLQSNNVDTNLRDINLFMADRGTSGAQCIDRSDLCNLLVTKTNTKLRNEVYSRQSYKLPSNHFLNFELEYTITRIFEYELNLLREIQHYIYVLNQKSDFSIFDSFQEVDINFTNYYNVKELVSFFERCGRSLSARAAEGSVMRLDRHDSGRVSLHDFTVLFDTYTGKYVPNGKQMENLLNYQENKTKSFDNCKFFLG